METHKQFPITILDDDIFEEDEHFYVRLSNLRTGDSQGMFDSNNSGAGEVKLIPPFVATVMILDDDHPGIFHFEEKEMNVPEAIGEVEIKVVRSIASPLLEPLSPPQSTDRSKDNPKELCRSVKYKGDSCVITVDEKSSNQPEKDIFLGVSYRKTARYYLSGIDKLSTSLGIQNYIQSKGIKITHFVLFKPKPRSRLLSAKLNVPLQHAESIEHHDFWPNGVRCRKWFSERQ